METDAAPSSARPRPMLLILLAAVAVVFAWMQFGGSSDEGAPPPAQRTAPQQTGAAAKVDPDQLDVDLESLAGERPGPGDSERNPFRFQAKAPPPSQAPPPSVMKPAVPAETGPVGPPPPPAAPPITVKFLGIVDLPNGTTRAVFTDCTGVGRRTAWAGEGEPVLGQYRLIKIGLQSVVIEHLDGRGRTTLAKTGQDCVTK